jgi:hypothetical protein
MVVGGNQLDFYDFSSNFLGWQRGIPSDNASTGHWEVDATHPTIVTSTGAVDQAPDDHTQFPDDSMCAVTSATSSTTAGQDDVDEGVTTLVSPAYDLSNKGQPSFSYYRYFSNAEGANPGNDPWQAYITHEDTGWITVEHTYVKEKKWRHYAFNVSDYFDFRDKTAVKMKFVASDSVLSSQSNNGQSLVEAGVDDFSLYSGCDSTSHTRDTIEASDCDSMYTVPSGDETYYTSGTYMDTISNTRGCDSILTINLTVDSSSETSFNTFGVTKYDGIYIVPSGDETYTTNDTLITTVNDTVPNHVGCDSVLTINLSLYDTTGTGLSAPQAQNRFDVRPNPAQNYVKLYLGEQLQQGGETTVKVVNITGEAVYRETLSPNMPQKRISTADWPEGVYFIRLSNKEGVFTRKVLLR